MPAPPPADVAATLTADTLAVIASRAGLSLEHYVAHGGPLPQRATEWLSSLVRLEPDATRALERLVLVRSCQFIDPGIHAEGPGTEPPVSIKKAKEGLESASSVCGEVASGNTPSQVKIEEALAGLREFVSQCEKLRVRQMDMTGVRVVPGGASGASGAADSTA